MGGMESALGVQLGPGVLTGAGHGALMRDRDPQACLITVLLLTAPAGPWQLQSCLSSHRDVCPAAAASPGPGELLRAGRTMVALIPPRLGH